MAGIRKRRAPTQLTKDGESEEAGEVEDVPGHVGERRAKLKAVRKREVPTEIKKGIFKNFDFSQAVQGLGFEAPKIGRVGDENRDECVARESTREEKIVGLNRSFIKAAGGVLEKDEGKDISYLFRQYEEHLRVITELGTGSWKGEEGEGEAVECSMRCKLFVNRGAKFEPVAVGVIEVVKRGGRERVIFKESDNVLLNMVISSVRANSKEGAKEVALIEIGSKDLYKVKFGTLEDSDSFKKYFHIK